MFAILLCVLVKPLLGGFYCYFPPLNRISIIPKYMNAKLPKKNKRALFAGSLHSRQSTISNRSHERVEPQKNEHSHSTNERKQSNDAQH